MREYKVKTIMPPSVGLSPSKYLAKFDTRFEAVLNEYAADGYKIFKIKTNPNTGYITIIFEKETSIVSKQ